MAVNLPLQTLISQGLTEAKTFAVLEVQFGDGYSQRALDGLNYERATVTLNYENVTSAEASTIENALVSSLSSHLVYNSKTYFLEGYNITSTSGDLKTVAVTMKRVHDI